MNPVPDLTAETKPWERVLAKISHVLLYALIFAMPLTGWMMSSAQAIYPVSWFKLFQFPDLVGAGRADLSPDARPAPPAVQRAGRPSRCCTSPARSNIISSTGTTC